jgi:TetR/AcrR family transcriptional regulator, transcriptional repressor for nem operon
MPQKSLRDKFMAAALKRFRESGFKACTIEDIASEAGTVKGSFYNYFESKEALAVAVVKMYSAAGRATLALEGPPLPIKRLHTHFENLRALLDKNHRFDGCLLANFSAELSEENSDLKKSLTEALEIWSKQLAQVIRQAQSEGEIGRHHDADQLARFLVNAWEGTYVRVRAVKKLTPLDDFMKVAFTKILS